jgi:hypothetical protein
MLAGKHYKHVRCGGRGSCSGGMKVGSVGRRLSTMSSARYGMGRFSITFSHNIYHCLNF